MSESTNEMQPQNQEKKNNRSIWVIILIALLVGTNIYLYVKLNSKQEVVKELTTAANMDSLKISDLDTKYTSALNDIESLKGQNTSLDSLLTVKANEVKTMKAALDAARKSKKLSDKEYGDKVANLQKLVDDLKNQITILEKEIQKALPKEKILY